MVINRALNKLIPLVDELMELEVPYCGEISVGFPSEVFNYTEEGIGFKRFKVLRYAESYELCAIGQEHVDKDVKT
jgi:hypothetical protein